MTIFALISLLSFVAALFLAAFIFFQDTKSLINRLYFVVCMSIAMYSFIEFGYRQSSSYEEAEVWWQFDVFWSVHIACWLHLAVAFTEKQKWLKSKVFYGLLYGPVVAFILLDIFGHNITGPPVEEAWGWSYGVRENWLNTASYLWIITLPIAAAVMYIFYYRKIQDRRKLQQARLIMVGGLTAVTAQFAELMIKLLNIQLPPIIIIGFIFMNAIIAYAIWKYELFTLTPSKAAESIIATMGDSLMLVGLDGTIISANHATSRMIGLSEKQLIGRGVKEIFAPSAIVPVWIQDSQTDGHNTINSRDIETEYLSTDGAIIPISLSGSMLYDDDGNLRGFLLIARDIAERKKAEDEIVRHREHLEELVEERTSQLSKTNVQLQQEINERQKAETEKKELQDQLHQAQKMEAIGRLAGGVAHDFNNLLFVINGYSETLLCDLSPDDPARVDLLEIAKAGKRAVNLTRQLLAFSRKQVIDPVLIDVNERIESSRKMLARLIGEDIIIDFSNRANLGKVVMDVSQLDQIIANLVVNARDAMPVGGTIRILTDNVRITQEDCTGFPERNPGSYVFVSVKDTGCGIEKEKLKMVFEPFYTSKDVGKGTGLGLATVYGIVKQNAGFIEVESSLGTGSEFSIYLPRAGKEGLTSDAAWDEVPVVRGTETVMLIEDNHMVRRLAKRQLQNNGYNVIEAVDGLVAQDIFLLHKEEIDVILTDVVMPGQSGVELIEKLKEVVPDVKVLFISGHNEEIIDQHGIRKTQYPLLSKPFSAQQLCDKLRDVLDGHISVAAPLPFE